MNVILVFIFISVMLLIELKKLFVIMVLWLLFMERMVGFGIVLVIVKSDLNIDLIILLFLGIKLFYCEGLFLNIFCFVFFVWGIFVVWCLGFVCLIINGMFCVVVCLLYVGNDLVIWCSGCNDFFY